MAYPDETTPGSRDTELLKDVPLYRSSRFMSALKGVRYPLQLVRADHRDVAEALRSPEGVTCFRTYVPHYEIRAIGVVAKDRAPLNSSNHHVVEDAGGIQTRLARHGRGSVARGVIGCNVPVYGLRG